MREIKRIVVKDRPHQPNEWFTLDVTAQDNHITIKVNGKTTVDFINAQRHFTQGHFALQQHDAQSTVEFRRLDLAQPAAGPSPFFNGKDLTGWEGLAEYWKVQDGALYGRHNGLKFSTFLCSKRKYKDFELQFRVKLSEGGNSGVQIRSKIHDLAHFAVTGPQCDMGGPFWGSFYGDNFSGTMRADPRQIERVLRKNDFNDYHIKCIGNHVTITLNGETTVNDDFPDMLPADGIIAWQLHANNPMEVIFRNIQFKDLSP